MQSQKGLQTTPHPPPPAQRRSCGCCQTCSLSPEEVLTHWPPGWPGAGLHLQGRRRRAHGQGCKQWSRGSMARGGGGCQQQLTCCESTLLGDLYLGPSYVRGVGRGEDKGEGLCLCPNLMLTSPPVKIAAWQAGHQEGLWGGTQGATRAAPENRAWALPMSAHTVPNMQGTQRMRPRIRLSLRALVPDMPVQ